MNWLHPIRHITTELSCLTSAFSTRTLPTKPLLGSLHLRNQGSTSSPSALVPMATINVLHISERTASLREWRMCRGAHPLKWRQTLLPCILMQGTGCIYRLVRVVTYMESLILRFQVGKLNEPTFNNNYAFLIYISCQSYTCILVSKCKVNSFTCLWYRLHKVPHTFLFAKYQFMYINIDLLTYRMIGIMNILSAY